MKTEAEQHRDAAIVISWLVGLHDENPSDAGEQWPLAWAAARAWLKSDIGANDV